MTDILNNPYNLEFREGRGGRLVIYHNRNIARISQDGTLMAHATEAARTGNALESLGLSKAMFLVESEEQFEGVLQWPGLKMFDRLTLNLYFVTEPRWLVDVITRHAASLQHMQLLHVTGPFPLPPLMADEALKLFENIPDVNLFGN